MEGLSGGGRDAFPPPPGHRGLAGLNGHAAHHHGGSPGGAAPFPAHLWSRAPPFCCSPYGAGGSSSALDLAAGAGHAGRGSPATSLPSALVSPASPCPVSAAQASDLLASYYSPANFYHSSRLALYGSLAPQPYPTSTSLSPLFPYLSIPSPFSPYALAGSTADPTAGLGYPRADSRSGFWFPPALDRECLACSAATCFLLCRRALQSLQCRPSRLAISFSASRLRIFSCASYSPSSSSAAFPTLSSSLSPSCVCPAPRYASPMQIRDLIESNSFSFLVLITFLRRLPHTCTRRTHIHTLHSQLCSLQQSAGHLRDQSRLDVPLLPVA